MTNPDPLPPTMAIFFPAGTLNDKPFNIGRSGTYPNLTSSKVTVFCSGDRIKLGALGFSYRVKDVINEEELLEYQLPLNAKFNFDDIYIIH